MTKQEIWAPRVAAWRASGETLAAYCTNKPFTSGGLRYWIDRLAVDETAPRSRPTRANRASTERPQVLAPSVALTRVVVARAARGVTSTALPTGTIVVEVGAARIGVSRGFDAELLHDVVRALAAGAA